MKINIINLENKVCGEIALNEAIFALTPRQDIIKRVIDWQRAKAMQGTHHAKTISEVSGTTKKPFKQKGTGSARQGSLRSVHMRGGGVSHGPVVRSHATKLPKKVRKLGLCHALSSKMQEGKLLILENLTLSEMKTSTLNKHLKNFDAKNFFFIGGEIIENNILLAMKNLKNAMVVPHLGANVYDVVKHDLVILSKDAVNILEARLK